MFSKTVNTGAHKVDIYSATDGIIYCTLVGDNEIISKINQSAEKITIQASKIDLDGYVTMDNFSSLQGEIDAITGGDAYLDSVNAGMIDADDIDVGDITV